MIRAISFDAAGTLIDHRWNGGRALCHGLRELGMAAPDERSAIEAYDRVSARLRALHEEVERRRDAGEIKRYWRTAAEQWLIEIGGDPCLATELQDVCERNVFSAENQIWSLYPDVMPALEGLKARGLIIGIVSNWDSSLHKVLDALRVADRFDFVIASLEHGCEKPERRLFEIAEKQGWFSASEALHVGDSLEDDYWGALGAGWKAVLLDRLGAGFGEARTISRLDELLREDALCA